MIEFSRTARVGRGKSDRPMLKRDYLLEVVTASINSVISVFVRLWIQSSFSLSSWLYQPAGSLSGVLSLELIGSSLLITNSYGCFIIYVGYYC